MDKEFSKKIKKELRLLVDDKYYKMYGNKNSLGVRIPILRKYAKNLYKEYSLDYLLKNIGEDYFEEILLKGFLIGLNENLSWEELEKYIEYYVPKINSWGICDCFCASLKIVKKYREQMWILLNKYLKVDSEYQVRFALVIILTYYIDDEYIDRIYNIINEVKLDKYYVKMANSWLISYCLIKYYDKTIVFLENSDIDKWTYNKGIQKAIESYRIGNKEKEYLRKIKK